MLFNQCAHGGSIGVGSWRQSAAWPGGFVQSCQRCFICFESALKIGLTIAKPSLQGTVIVKAPFKKEAKELILQPFQASLLILFNDTDEMSVADMMERLNIPEVEVVRTVSSLAHGKEKILLRKKGAGGEDKEKKKPTRVSIYTVNWSFTSKYHRSVSSLLLHRNVFSTV